MGRDQSARLATAIHHEYLYFFLTIFVKFFERAHVNVDLKVLTQTLGKFFTRRDFFFHDKNSDRSLGSGFVKSLGSDSELDPTKVSGSQGEPLNLSSFRIVMQNGDVGVTQEDNAIVNETRVVGTSVLKVLQFMRGQSELLHGPPRVLWTKLELKLLAQLCLGYVRYPNSAEVIMGKGDLEASSDIIDHITVFDQDWYDRTLKLLRHWKVSFMCTYIHVCQH